MKRILALCCVLALLVSLSACDSIFQFQANVKPPLQLEVPGNTTVLSPSTPAQTDPAPTQTDPVPTQTDPAATNTAPAPTETIPVPTESAPPPTQTVPAPTQCVHSYSITERKASTCTVAGSETYTCGKCGDSYRKALALAEHTPVTDAAVAATCTTAGKTEGSHCSACKAVLVQQQTIPASAHTVVLMPGKKATETEDGLTDGKKCSSCSTVLVQQTVIPAFLESCSSDYAYKNLAAQSNGGAKQTLYGRIDSLAKAFHMSGENVTDNIAFGAAFSDLNLSEQDAMQVWMSYRNDHPLYFWISGTVAFADGKVAVWVSDEYISGTARQTCKQLVYDKLAQFKAKAAGETSAYQIALAYHDAIIESMDYANDSAGNPEQAAWAHNVLGAFEKGSGVCEAYARTFQLLLNASGVENIFVSGIGGSSNQENHAWNLVKLDDGQWYWCDLTWDDTPQWEWGVSYNYFCVNDTQAVNWKDSWDPQPAVGFLSDHTVGVSTDPQLHWQIDLPNRAAETFRSTSKPIIRETFTVDGMTYSVNGFRTVQLVKVSAGGELQIPETVTYRGDKYTVTSVGALRESDGLYDDLQTVLAENTKITIPRTVRFIWDGALRYYTVTEYVVDSTNPWFTSVNGVLYTKSLYTLISYPRNAPKTDRFVVPEATRWIANNAFDGMQNPFGELVLNQELEGIGITNWGLGYRDAPLVSQGGGISFGGNTVSGNLGAMVRWCNGMNSRLVITVPEDCRNFAQKDGVVYAVNGITGFRYYRALAAADTDISTAVIQEGAIEIGMDAFNGCKKLASVTVPASVTELGSGCFGYNDECSSLKEIRYGGTAAQWNGISKPSYLAKPQVICTDATIAANMW